MEAFDKVVGTIFKLIAKIPPVNRFLENIRPKRPMKFPYTFSAKIAQFPYRLYYEKDRVVRYYPLAVVLSMPFFYYCERLCKFQIDLIERISK